MEEERDATEADRLREADFEGRGGRTRGGVSARAAMAAEES